MATSPRQSRGLRSDQVRPAFRFEVEGKETVLRNPIDGRPRIVKRREGRLDTILELRGRQGVGPRPDDGLEFLIP